MYIVDFVSVKWKCSQAHLIVLRLIEYLIQMIKCIFTMTVVFLCYEMYHGLIPIMSELQILNAFLFPNSEKIYM